MNYDLLQAQKNQVSTVVGPAFIVGASNPHGESMRDSTKSANVVFHLMSLTWISIGIYATKLYIKKKKHRDISGTLYVIKQWD